MDRPTLPASALLTRLVAVCLAAAAIIAPLLVGYRGGDRVMAGLTYWLSLVAPAFYIWGLWSASNVMARIHHGEAFGPAMTQGLRNLGISLMVGAFFAILVQPSLFRLFENGFTAMTGVTFALNIQNVSLALVGFVLVLLAREGRRLKSNLEQFV